MARHLADMDNGKRSLDRGHTTDMADEATRCAKQAFVDEHGRRKQQRNDREKMHGWRLVWLCQSWCAGTVVAMSLMACFARRAADSKEAGEG